MIRTCQALSRIAKHIFTCSLVGSLAVFSAQDAHGQTFDYPSAVFADTMSLKRILQTAGDDTVEVTQDATMTSATQGGSPAFIIKSVLALANFKVNVQSDSVSKKKKFTYMIQYKMIGFPNLTNLSIKDSTALDTLTVSYDRDSLQLINDNSFKVAGSYQKLYIIIKNVYEVTGSGTSLTYTQLTPLVDTNVAPFVFVIGEVHLQKYVLHASLNMIGISATNNINTDGTVHINWTSSMADIKPAGYEIEWTYVSQYGSQSYDFRNNATRVFTNKTEFKIPVAQKEGHVVYRVRMVRPELSNLLFRTYGPWSLSADNGSISGMSAGLVQIPASVSDSLNWDLKMSFVEDGKYKQVITYYDGLLKPKQVQTRFNSRPSQTIVAQSLYDHEGRAVISSLPIPVNGVSKFSFISNFLRPANHSEYAKSMYDAIPNPNACPPVEIAVPALDTAAPANKYYSRNNPDKTGKNAFIPDAEGFPFVRKILAPENSEKVLFEGKAGAGLQMGNGRHMSYLYGTPIQAELNRYFGQDVGKADYYRKMITTDNHKQDMFSITDDEGRIVASGLIKTPDTSSLALDIRNAPVDKGFHSNLLPIPNIRMDEHWLHNGSYFVESQANYEFTYGINYNPFKPCPGIDVGLSPKVYYNYEVIDNCGNTVIRRNGVLGNTGIVSPWGNLNVSKDSSKLLEKGKHVWNKYAYVSIDDMRASVDAFLDNGHGCFIPYDSFFKAVFIDADFPCVNNYDPCGSMRLGMIKEMYPLAKYGQYTYNDPTSKLYSSPATNSIFTIITGQDIPKYKAACIQDSVTVRGKRIGLKSTSQQDLINIFNDSVAAALLPLHPDYCKLQLCYVINNPYVKKLSAISKASEATTINRFVLSDIINNDPLYTNNLLTQAQLSKTIDDSLSLDSIAFRKTICGSEYSIIESACTRITMQQTPASITAYPDYIQDAYYKKLIEQYHRNRENRLGILLRNYADSCGPCASLRLVNPDEGPGFGNESDTSILIGSMDSLNKNLDKKTGSFDSYFGSGSSSMNADSLDKLKNADNSKYCTELVSYIKTSLAACNVSQATLDAFADTLKKRFCENGNSITSLSYDSLTSIMSQAGIAESDLCNAGLADLRRITRKSHDYVQLGLLHYQPAYYSDLRNFIDSTDIFGFILGGADTMSVDLKLCDTYPFQQNLARQLGASLPPPNCTRTRTVLLVKTNMSTDSSHSVRLAFTKNGDTVAYYLYPAISKERNALDTVFGTTKISNPDNFQARSLFNMHGFDKLSKSFANRNTIILDFDATKDNVQRKFTYFLSAYNQQSDYNTMEADKKEYLNGIACSEFIPMAVSAVTKAEQLNIKYGHPYFEKYFTHVVNDQNEVNFDFKNYNTAIQTCGVTDTITIQKHLAHFRIRFPTTKDIDDIEAFVDSLKRPDTISIADAKVYHLDNYDYLLLDVNEVAARNMKDIKAVIAARVPSGSVVEYLPYQQRDTVAKLFVYDTEVPNMPLFRLNLENAFPGTNVTEEALDVYQIVPGYGRFQLLGTCFTMTDTIASHYIYNHLVDSIYKFVRINAPMTTVFTHAESAVSSQYYDWQMTAWRSYVMGLGTTNHNDIVKKSKAEKFKALTASSGSISFDSSSFSYVNERSPYFLNNLYIDHHPTTNDNYEYILKVLHGLDSFNQSFYVKKTILMPLHVSLPHISNIAGIGTQTRPYICGDTTQFWINHFDANHKMINIFIQLPQYLALPREAYEVVGVNKGAEQDTVSYAILTMAAQNGSGLKDTIRCIAYTNKNLGETYTIPSAFLSSHSRFETLSGKFENCETRRMQDLHPMASILYAHYRDSVRNLLVSKFRQHIIDSLHEYFTIKGNDIKHGLTLYYYDVAGNLIMTVPPAGVAELNVNDPHNTNINNARVNHTGTTSPTVIPAHQKPTKYVYNAQDKVITTTTPDAGTTNNFYDMAGRVVVSQNAQQATSNACTYFLYDNLSRVIETGMVIKDPKWDATYFDDINDIITFNSAIKLSNRKEVTATMYDTASYNPSGVFSTLPAQDNLKNRVSCTKYFEAVNWGINASKDTGYVHALHYSYDISGNVKTLIHDLRNEAEKMLRFKRVDYEYDLYSGKVIMLAYNRGYADQMYQKYTYDSDNRITDVHSSNNGVYWDRDANYRYYDHGPLARTELGEQRVQGVDYAYTINGWLKAVNGTQNNPLNDMGADGTSGLVMPKDVFSQRIDYFGGDYKAIKDSNTFRELPATNKSLYNGNIAAIATALTPFDNIYNKYHYDPLQRIARANYEGYTINNSTSPATATKIAMADYASYYKYDKDGNILELYRNGGYVPALLNGGTAISMQPMDTLKYHYTTGTNKLQSLADIASATAYKIDIQPLAVDTSLSRYRYDHNGNLTKDIVSGLDTIIWTNSGKVKSITKADGSKIHFTYDALGNRLTKDVVKYPANDSMVKLKTLYVRDASGNILAVYDDKKEYDVTKITYSNIVGAPLGPITKLPIFKPVGTAWGDKLHDKYVNAPSTYTFAKLAMAIPTLSEYADASASMQNFVSSLQQTEGLSFIKSLPAITAYTLDAPDGMPVTSEKLSAYMQGVMLSENLDDLQTDVFVALKDNNEPLYNSTVATIPASQQEKTEFPTNTAMLTAYKGMALGEKLTLTNLLAQALTTAHIATLPDVRAVMLDAYSTNNTYGNFVTELPDADVILDGMKQDAANYIGHRYTQADLGNVALSTVKAQFSGNSVLAGILSAGLDPEPEALSDILCNHYAASVTLAGSSSQGAAFADALKNVLISDGTLFDKVFPAEWTKITQVMTLQRQHLAEHHLYGSSRVGLQKYLPQQIQYEYKLADSTTNLNTLTSTKPWYSLYGNDLFHPTTYNNNLSNATINSAFNSAGMGINSHVLGNRHYELTNHLGNVQAVVLDRATPIFNQSDSIVTGYTSDINLAHDYYPFGMLMPGRYVADDSQKCVTINTTVLVPKYQKIHHILLASPAANHTGGGSGTYTPTHKLPKASVQAQEAPHVYHYNAASTHPNGKVISGAMVDGNSVYTISLSEEASNAVSSFMHIHADTTVEAQELGFELELPQDVIADVRVRQYVDTSEEYIEALTWSTITQSGSVQLTVPINKAYVKAGGPTLVEMKFKRYGNVGMDPGTTIQWKNYWTKLTHYEPQTRIVKICDEKDNYRFGFNGIEKTNEIAGIGNHYTALFGEYDPRTVYRWNRDPKPVAWESPYAMFRGNPIWYVDPLLDYSRIGAAWRNIRDGGSGAYKSGNDWGYNAPSKKYKGEYASFFGGKGKSDMTTYNRADAASYKFDRWAERTIAPAMYKVFGEWNPVSQGATNLGSSVTGRDMTIPAWSEGSQPGANVSGELLSPARRFTTGVNGTTQFIGLGLGGLQSFGTDLLLNAGGDLANKAFNDDNAGNNMKYGIHALKLQQAIKNNDVNGFFEEMIGVTNTNSGQVDNQLKNEQK